ncbi:hypothetical protein HG531_012478 [Fusarium graminearum]|nr:hypothetical protein HG531_012478 [Fusarium graminearum]
MNFSRSSSAASSTLSSLGRFSVEAAAGLVVAVSSSESISPFDDAAVAGESIADESSEESDLVNEDRGPVFKSFVLVSDKKDSGRVLRVSRMLSSSTTSRNTIGRFGMFFDPVLRSRLLAILDLVKLVKEGVEFAQTSLSLNHLLKSIDLALHQLGILVSLGQTCILLFAAGMTIELGLEIVKVVLGIVLAINKLLQTGLKLVVDGFDIRTFCLLLEKVSFDI